MAFHNDVMKHIKKVAFLITLPLLFTAFTAATVHTDQPRTTTPDVQILITGKEHPSGFLPALLSVYVNQKIIFVNNAKPATTYHIVAENNSFASPGIAPGQQWILHISSPGQYEYTDPAFKQQMVGVLNVVPLSANLLPPANPSTQATAVATLKNGPTNQLSQPNLLPLFIAGIIIVIVLVAFGIFIWGVRHRRG